MPMPTTTRDDAPADLASHRIPAHFRSSNMRSFGHFRRVSTLQIARIADRAASDAQNPTAGSTAFGTSAGSIVEHSNPAATDECQERPARPRPASWDSVTNDMPRASYA